MALPYLEVLARGRSRPLKLAPFEFRALRNGFLFAFHSNFDFISCHFRDKAIYMYWSLGGGECPRWNSDMPFDTDKLECCGYSTVKRFDDTFSLFDRIPACDRQTDRQTDGRTDILPEHSPRYAYASRGNNKLSCRRGRARCFVSLHISLSHSRLFEMTPALE